MPGRDDSRRMERSIDVRHGRVAALVGLAQFHRHLRGEGGSLFSSRKAKQPRADASELEALIEAYRRDKSAGGGPGASVLPKAAAATPAAAPVPAMASAPTAGKPPGAFLHGPPKVLYLVLKAALPDHQRQALILFAIEKMPQKEVAEIMECSVEMVKWNVFQARKALKQSLASHLER